MAPAICRATAAPNRPAPPGMSGMNGASAKRDAGEMGIAGMLTARPTCCVLRRVGPPPRASAQPCPDGHAPVLSDACSTPRNFNARGHVPPDHQKFHHGWTRKNKSKIELVTD